MKLEKIDFDGIKTKVKSCKPPTDIIWMNRGIGKTEQTRRFCIVTLIIIVGTVFVYILFTSEVTSKIYINYRQLPPGVVCDNLMDAYGK